MRGCEPAYNIINMYMTGIASAEVRGLQLMCKLTCEKKPRYIYIGACVGALATAVVAGISLGCGRGVSEAGRARGAACPVPNRWSVSADPFGSRSAAANWDGRCWTMRWQRACLFAGEPSARCCCSRYCRLHGTIRARTSCLVPNPLSFARSVEAYATAGQGARAWRVPQRYSTPVVSISRSPDFCRPVLRF